MKRKALTHHAVTSTNEGRVSGITRRDFFAGSALGVAGIAASGLFGCSPSEVDESADSAASDFETPPEPIPDSEISETVEAEVVVVGAGDAGLTASLAASELGASVVLIDKHEKFMAHGLAHACIGTKIHKENGIEHDKNAIIAHLAAQSNNRADMRLLHLWADESGAIYDKLIDMALANDIAVIPMGGGDSNETMFPEYNCALMFQGTTPIESDEAEGAVAQTWLFTVIEQAIRDNGADIRYNVCAQQLVRGDDGRVSAVIATNEDGSYVRFNASKGVVLATGDYGNNPEMVQKWCPWQTLADVNFYTPPINTGDGHKMGLWVGGIMQNGPHCPALHPERVVGQDEPPMGASPILRVNANGVRYENEQVPAPMVCEGRIRQPGNIAWAIFDSNWQEDAPKMSPGLLRTPAIIEHNIEMLEANATKADTLEELADAIGIPADAFVDTVTRYTELAKKGVDEDFGKTANNLWPIEKAPFYAIEVPVGTMNTIGGLLVNTNMQVLDSEGDGVDAIPGLYAAGNVSGGFFGSTYPSAVSGINKGWSIVGGYLAGKHAASDN